MSNDNSSRMRTIFRSKTRKALDKIEDPRETLDDSYDQQVKLLQQVRKAVAEVATAKKRIELQGQEIGTRYQRLGSQAREAVVQGREDLARAALERRALLESQVAKLQEQYTALQKQTEQLQERERRLTEQVAAFRIEKETIKATYTASEAQVKANEAVAGIVDGGRVDVVTSATVLITWAAMSAGWTPDNPPPRLPTGVRTASTM